MIDFSLLDEGKLFEYTMRILRQYGLSPKKRLGQNFIINMRVVRGFLSAISQIKHDRLFEFGTGLGVLTYYVAKDSGKHLISVEKDRNLYLLAVSLLAELDNVYLLNGDGLMFLESMKVPAVFSSTPYNLSSQIILKICRNNNIVDSVLGVQKEVALRLMSHPGSSNFGRLSVITQLLLDIKLLDFYPPSYFHPAPEVSGALLYLKRKKNYEIEVHRKTEKLTECAFSFRNKLALKILKRCVREVININLNDEDLLKLGINKDWRVRDIAPDIFERLAREEWK